MSIVTENSLAQEHRVQGDAPSAPPPAVKPVAVIDIGSTSIRMAVAEIDTSGGIRTLENLSQAVNLGKDAFTLGHIEKETTERCVNALKSYRRLLEEYQITHPDQIHVVATSAVREAENRLSFLDRIYIATGLQVEPLDEAEVSRITYLGVQSALKRHPSLASATNLVIEVGGGSTELLLVQGGDVTYSHTYRLGSQRLRETLEVYRAPERKVRQIMENQIRRAMDQVRQNVVADGPIEIVALGGDVRYAATQLQAGWDRRELTRLNVADLEEFTDEMLGYSVDELVHDYHLSYPDAESLGPALLAYVELARVFHRNHLYVSNVNLRDGLLREMAAKEGWTEEFRNQVIRSAVALGRRYRVDEKHARHVAELCGLLFAALEDEHRLGARYEVLMYVAALLHESGLYVGTGGYHKHSMYLIANSELFGLSARDVTLVSLVARFHRRATPKPTHQGYAGLDREQRIAVSKLAALLRLAKALDESRSQRIQEIECSRESGRFVIGVPGVEDLSLEQLAIKQNAELFEDIFGMQVVLRQIRRRG